MASCIGLLLVRDLALRPFGYLGTLAFGFAGLLWATRCLRRSPVSARSILLTAALLRLLVLPLEPTLSEDIYRYLWDGRVLAAGFNPYTLAPEAEPLIDLRDDLWLRVSHREVPTVYPPLAMSVFSIAGRSPFPLLTLKAALCLADLLSCYLLLVLARRMGVATTRTLWYAWNPLVIVEVAGMGHVDALGVPAVLGAVVFLQSLTSDGRPPQDGEGIPSASPLRPSRPPRWGRLGRVAGASAAGILAKLVPVVALPMWARQSRRPWVFLLMVCMILSVAGLPVVWSAGGIPPGLVIYGVSWEFNGPVFEPLWRFLQAIHAAVWVKEGLDVLKAGTGLHGFWNRLYPYVYPQFLAKILLAAGLLLVVGRSLREEDPVVGTGRLMEGALLLSATLYPWYLLWVLPWAALNRRVCWLALSATIQLTYVAQLARIPLVPWFFLLIWVPFATAWGLERKWSID